MLTCAAITGEMDVIAQAARIPQVTFLMSFDKEEEHCVAILLSPMTKAR